MKSNYQVLNVREAKNRVNENISEMQERLSELVGSASQKSTLRNIEAYEFTLKLLNALSDEIILEIPANKSDGLNVGAVGEVAVKHFITGDTELSMATSNQNDIDRVRMNEVKVWSSVNRNPNAMNDPYGFIAVSRNGVHYITKKIVEKYWNEFADKNGKKTISRKMLETILEVEQPNRLKMLSEKLGL